MKADKHVVHSDDKNTTRGLIITEQCNYIYTVTVISSPKRTILIHLPKSPISEEQKTLPGIESGSGFFTFPSLISSTKQFWSWRHSSVALCFRRTKLHSPGLETRTIESVICRNTSPLLERIELLLA